MSAARVRIPEAQIEVFCRRNEIHKHSLFGSVLTDRFCDTSDIDILVEFEPERRDGYFKIAAMERELSTLFGRKVDLRTPNELSRYFRDDVMKSAQVQYAGD